MAWQAQGGGGMRANLPPDLGSSAQDGLGALGGVTTSDGLRGRVAQILQAKRDEALAALQASRRARGAADQEKRRKWLEQRDSGKLQHKLVVQKPDTPLKKKPVPQTKAGYLTGGMVALGPAIIKKRPKPKAPPAKPEHLGKAPRIEFVGDIRKEAQMTVSNAYRQAIVETIWKKLIARGDRPLKKGQGEALAERALQIELQLLDGVADTTMYRSRAAALMTKFARGQEPIVPPLTEPPPAELPPEK